MSKEMGAGGRLDIFLDSGIKYMTRATFNLFEFDEID